MKDSPKKIACDTSAFVALLSKRDPEHKACIETLDKQSKLSRFYTTESCLTEVSFLLPQNQNLRQKLQQMLELLNIEVVALSKTQLGRVYELMDKYNDLPMDFADAALTAACENQDIRYVFTLDRKDFSIYRPRHCARFKILPES